MYRSDRGWKLIVTVFLAGIILLSVSCQSSGNIKLQEEINKISAQIVPDQRTELCNIKINSSGNGSMVLSGETTSRIAKDTIFKTLSSHCKSLIDSIIILPDTASDSKYMGLATLSVINLRKKPEESAELVSQARLGTPVKILKRTGKWILIQTPDKYISWTEDYSVKPFTLSEMSDWRRSSRILFIEKTGWIYNAASVDSGVVGDLVQGSILEKTGEVKGYDAVILPDGRTGYALKQDFIDFNIWKNSVQCSEESVCREAQTFIGVPYLWGGSSIKGVDCSGFVQSVYFLNGMILQRDASLLALHGATVDISDGFGHLRKGDLLFFGSKIKGAPHVTHVAMCIGNNEYINSSGRVMLNSLDSTKADYNSYRIKALLSVKRIIGSENDHGIIRVSRHPWY